MSRPRLTGGSARGRTLTAPVPDGVRPTSSRVREALFSMLGQDLSGLTVLDAFSGSGLLALEAWSRGARVIAVERDRGAIAAIEQNVSAMGAPIELLRGDLYALAADPEGPLRKGDRRFEIVLADPPYREPPEKVVAALGPLSAGWLVVEADAKRDPPAPPPGFDLDRRKEYGDSALFLYLTER